MLKNQITEIQVRDPLQGDAFVGICWHEPTRGIDGFTCELERKLEDVERATVERQSPR